jgi:MFS family permease
MKPFPHFLRALESRNYRIYISGQCISYLGNWMTATASLWLSYHLSHSPFVVGLVGFANWIPLLLLAPFAGVLVDRIDGLRLVRITQTLAMLQTGALAVLTLSGHITVPNLIGLCLLQGLIYAFDDSARQMLLFRLVEDRTLLDNVFALNSISINLTRLIGPALAGLLVAGVGPGVCYTIDALFYLPVLVALAAVRIAAVPARPREAHPLTDLREGLAYAWNHTPIRRVLLLVPVISLVGFTHTLLAPVFAREVFGGDARTLGFLMSTSGFGSLIGGAFLSTRRGAFVFPRAIAWSTFIGSAGFFGIAASPNLRLGLLSYAAAGLGATVFMVSSNTWLQQVVADDKRGRIMSLYGTGQGFYPIGSLLLGAFTAETGPRLAIAFCGLVLLASGSWFVRAFFGTSRNPPAGVYADLP